MPETFHGRVILHKVLGNRHKSLEGRRFRKPPAHLYERLTRLRAHRWHTHFKHVVIAGVDGRVVCDRYCDFDVPTNVYGDFVAAVDEAKAVEEEPVAPAGASTEDYLRQRLATEHGWNKAVAILEEAAAEDGKTATEAADGKEHFVDQPSEQVDVSLEDGGGKKG